MSIDAEEFTRLTTPAVLAALREHAGMDAKDFALRFGGRSDWPVRAMAEQLDCRRRAAAKLPGWPVHDMLFDKQGIEQCSHGLVARWRAGLMAGRRLWDVCGGLGIDTWAASAAGCAVTHCELDPDRARLAAWNHRDLAIAHVQGDGLASMPADQDLVFVDPSRRDASGRRSVALQHLQPDPLAIQEPLLAACRGLLWKLAPGTDRVALERQLQGLRSLAYVSVDGECKECLAVCGTERVLSRRYQAVLLGRYGERVLACDALPPRPQVCRPEQGQQLLIGDPAVRQAGLLGALSAQCCGDQPDLLLGGELPADFGRRFQIEAVLPTALKTLKRELGQRGIAAAQVLSRLPGSSALEWSRRLRVQQAAEPLLLLVQGFPEALALLLRRASPTTPRQ